MNTLYQKPPRARELRARARQALAGKWALAVLVTLLASILFATNGGVSLNFNVNTDLPFDLESQGGLGEEGVLVDKLEQIVTAVREDFAVNPTPYIAALIGLVLGVLAIDLLALLVGSNVRIGLARFRLSLLDGTVAGVGQLFFTFKNLFFRAVWLHLLRSLIMLGWGLLSFVGVFGVGFGVLFGLNMLIGPENDLLFAVISLFLLILCIYLGALIVVLIGNRYRMADYALADNPDMTAVDAIRESLRMTRGNAWRLFCLDFSFIGWAFLTLFTCGLGSLWLAPYQGQAEAAFYDAVSGRAAVREAVRELYQSTEQI